MLLWLSNPKMTIKVEVQNGTIVAGAPIIRKFIGQSIENLLRWMKFEVKVLSDDASTN